MAIYGGPELARELAVEFSSMCLTLNFWAPHESFWVRTNGTTRSCSSCRALSDLQDPSDEFLLNFFNQIYFIFFIINQI